MFPNHYNSYQNKGWTEMQYSSISNGFTNLVYNKDDSEVNLIDLLDNTHISNSSHATDNNKEKQISDLQIKMLEEFCTTSKLPKQTEFHDAEFNSFLDKYEFNKLTETTDNKLKYEHILELEQKTVADGRSDSACALNLIETPKVLVPKLEEAFKPEPADRELNINEDLIEEVMFEQQMEKQLYVSINKTYQLRSDFDKEPISNQTSTNTSIHSKSYDDHDIFDEIVNKNKVSCFGKPTQNIPKTNPTKFFNANSGNTNYASQLQMNLDQKAFINELVTRYDIKYLEAMKKVDKVLKRSVLKSAVEKSTLTIGPTLYEKAVFLPQLMQCLSEKQKALDSKTTMKRRLILDTSQSCSEPTEKSTKSTIASPPKSLNTSISAELNLNNVMVLTPPQVLLADCNKTRLKAHETAKRFNNFVCNGTFPLHK